jgi:hypothetical protein
VDSQPGIGATFSIAEARLPPAVDWELFKPMEENSMKTLRIALSAALLLAASLSYTQTKPGDLVADVPFAFIVSGRTLPAGHYVVNNLGGNLGIHGEKSQVIFVPVHSAQRPALENSSKMVFHRYGDTYFLSEVWVRGNSTGKALFPSRAERNLVESGQEREIAVVLMMR